MHVHIHELAVLLRATSPALATDQWGRTSCTLGQSKALPGSSNGLGKFPPLCSLCLHVPLSDQALSPFKVQLKNGPCGKASLMPPPESSDPDPELPLPVFFHLSLPGITVVFSWRGTLSSERAAIVTHSPLPSLLMPSTGWWLWNRHCVDMN